MPDIANVQSTATSAGIPVAVESLGGADYQLVKLVAGQVGTSSPIAATTGVPAAGSTGLVVAVIPGVSVSAQVSGTVSVSGGISLSGAVSGTVSVSNLSTVVSGTVSISAMPAVSGTVSVSNLSTVVSGTVSVSNFTTVISGAVTAQVSGTVTIAPTILTVNTAATVAGASVTAQVSGTVTISPTVLTVNTAATIAGASVIAQVSGTITVSNLPGSTTGSSGMSGVLVWLGASQSVIISTQVSGTVSVSNTVIITLATGGTIAALLGSVQVSGTVTVSNGASVTIQAGASVVAQVSGTVTILPTTFTVNTQVSGTVSISGAVLATVTDGLSVTARVSGTVSILGADVTAAGVGQNVSGLVVRIGGGQSILGFFPVEITGLLSVVTPAGGTVAIDWGNARAGAMKFDSVTGTTSQGVFDGYVLGTTGVPASAVYAPIWKLAGSVQVSGTVSVSNTVVVTLATGGTVAVLDGASVAVAIFVSDTTAITSAPLWVTTGVPVGGVAGTGAGIRGLVVRHVGPITGNVITQQVSSGIPVWLAPTQTMSLVSTVGTVVAVSGVTAVSVVSTIGTILSTVVVTLPTQTPFYAIVTTTAPAISSTLIFSVWTGATFVGGAQTQYIIPAGKNLHIQGIQMVYAGSIGLAVTAQLNVNMGVSASLTTISQATQGKLAILQMLLSGAVTSTATLFGDFGDAPANQTVGLFWQGTSITIQQITINGYLF